MLWTWPIDLAHFQWWTGSSWNREWSIDGHSGSLVEQVSHRRFGGVLLRFPPTRPRE